MKTTKLFLIIALVTLTVISFGMNSENDILEFENELVMESWMTVPFQSMDNDPTSENWMILPFHSVSLENELVLENWMTTPFDLGTELEALALESWMITPFEATDDNCTGVLMTAACK